MLRWLAEQGVNLLVATSDGWTAALYAAEHGQFDTLRCIVEHAGPEALRAATSRGATCAHYAAQKGQLPMLQWIVEAAGMATLSAASEHGGTRVMFALEDREELAQPETLAHLHRLLAIPDEQLPRLCAHTRLPSPR